MIDDLDETREDLYKAYETQVVVLRRQRDVWRRLFLFSVFMFVVAIIIGFYRGL